MEVASSGDQCTASSSALGSAKFEEGLTGTIAPMNSGRVEADSTKQTLASPLPVPSTPVHP
jgi:hypothetical protein